MDKLVIAALCIFFAGSGPLFYLFICWCKSLRKSRPLPDWVDPEKWAESECPRRREGRR